MHSDPVQVQKTPRLATKVSSQVGTEFGVDYKDIQKLKLGAVVELSGDVADRLIDAGLVIAIAPDVTEQSEEVSDGDNN